MNLSHNTITSGFSGFFLIVLASFFWALDTLIRYPLINQGFQALHIVFYEHVFLTLLLLVFNLKDLSFIKRVKWSDTLSFLVVGALGSALATLSFTRAFNFLNPSLVILLQKFQPLIALLLARIILKEPLQRSFLGWSSICMVGVFLISYPDLSLIFQQLQGSHSWVAIFFESDSFIWGYILVLISIIGWGAATVFSRKLAMSGMQSSEILLGRFSFGSLALIPLIVIDADSVTSLTNYSLDYFSKIALMIFISGAVAMTIYYQGLKKIQARYATLAEMFFPLMAILINWIFLDQVLAPIQLMGGGILIVGSVVIQLKRL